MATRQDGFATIVEQEFESRSETLMKEDLKKSGLEDNDVFATPLKHPPIPMNNPQWVLGAYRIPYFDREGNILIHMYRDRMFYRSHIQPAALKEAGMGKYKGPSLEQAALNGVDARMPYLLPGGKGTTGIICEGEKKAAAALNRFQCHVLGIGGCNNWSDGSRRLHEDIIWWVNHHKLKTVVIVSDPDITTNRLISQGYSGLLTRLTAAFPDVQVRLIALEDKLDDLLVANDDYTLNSLLAEPDVEDIDLSQSIRDLIEQYSLNAKTNAAGIVSIRNTLENAYKLIANHPRWKDGLKFNEDLGTYELFGRPFIEDLNDAQITMTLSGFLHMPDVSKKLVKEAIKAIALEHSYSPARDDILAAGEWDKEERIKFAFGEDRTEQEIEIIKAWFVGYVKRVMEPGCFWRIMTHLVGPQGVGKTGMATWLAGDRRRVAIFEHGELEKSDKDVLIRLMRSKIALFDDIDTFGNRELGKLKALITQTHTLQRGAYKEMETFYARGGIMMGTSNHLEIIPDDPTGNSRHTVLVVREKQDWEWLNQNRMAMLAEAWALARAGWEPKNIDFEAISAAHTEQSEISVKLDEFVEKLRNGDKDILFIVGRKAKWWKADEFWRFFNNGTPFRPAGWQVKEFTVRAKSLGLGVDCTPKSSVDRTADGKTVKNVWRMPK